MSGELTLHVGVLIRCFLCYFLTGLSFIFNINLQYLNAGPGSIAGFFVHEKHAIKPQLTR